MACNPLYSALEIITRTLTKSEYVNFTSTSSGGEPSGDGMRHEILIDGIVMFDSGVEKGYTVVNAISAESLTLGTHTVVSIVTDGCLPDHQEVTSSVITITIILPECPALTASLSVNPTTISATGTLTWTSTAFGGVPTDNGYGHEILIDDIVMYNTGLRKGYVETGTLELFNVKAGTHKIKSKVTDGCLKKNQTAESPEIILTVYEDAPPGTKWACSGSPDYLCVENPNGKYTTRAACIDECKVGVVPPTTDPTLYYVAAAGVAALAIMYFMMRKKRK